MHFGCFFWKCFKFYGIFLSFIEYFLSFNFERAHISSTFSVLRPFSYLRPFLYYYRPTSTALLRLAYFDFLSNLDFLLVEKYSSK